MRFTRCIIRNRAISIYLCGLSLRTGDNGARTEGTIDATVERDTARGYVRRRAANFAIGVTRDTRGWSRDRGEMCLSASWENGRFISGGRGTTSCIAAGDFPLALRYSYRAAIILSSSQKFTLHRRLCGMMPSILLPDRFASRSFNVISNHLTIICLTKLADA